MSIDPTDALTSSHLDALRRRTVGVLFAGVALGSTGHIAAVTVTSIVALELGGDRTLAGLPAAFVVFGAAIGATMLGWVMGRWGRRPGLAGGYFVLRLRAKSPEFKCEPNLGEDTALESPECRMRMSIQRG